LAKLSEHAHEYDRLGEAEQFMFHLAKIERYQTRLRLMAFMSTFDEMYGVVQPVSGPHCVSVRLMYFNNLSFWCLESGKCAQCIFGAV
jgi:hypothetical protein